MVAVVGVGTGLAGDEVGEWRLGGLVLGYGDSGKSAPVMTIGSTARLGATVGSTTGSRPGARRRRAHAALRTPPARRSTTTSLTATFKRISLLQESDVPEEINAPGQ